MQLPVQENGLSNLRYKQGTSEDKEDSVDSNLNYENNHFSDCQYESDSSPTVICTKSTRDVGSLQKVYTPKGPCSCTLDTWAQSRNMGTPLGPKYVI